MGKRVHQVSLLAALVLVGLWAPALAGADVDFGLRVRFDDDVDVFLSVAARCYGQDRTTVQAAATRFRLAEDVALALLISSESRRPLEDIVDLRARGLSWWDISVRYRVPADVYFADLPPQPGPPFGRAWGHWKKHRNAARRMQVSDEELRDLVAVQLVHRYYDLSIEQAMSLRSHDVPLEAIVSREYRARHLRPDRENAPARAREERPGRGRGRGKGRGQDRHR
jgi:hypothetical protein